MGAKFCKFWMSVSVIKVEREMGICMISKLVIFMDFHLNFCNISVYIM